MQEIIDLGGPDGGRFWLVTSDHEAEHPDAQSAAVHARATGSVGCIYNGAHVTRHPFCAWTCVNCGKPWTDGHDCPERRGGASRITNT